MKKTHQVVMLPTQKANPNLFIHQGLGNKEKILSSGQGILHHKEMIACGVSKPQHLYIISDEKIKDGNWCIQTNYEKTHNELVKYKHCDKGSFIFKKIIASTDRSLSICKDCEILPGRCYMCESHNNPYSISQIPESFIQAYIKAYNEGKPITEVDLEYDANVLMDDGDDLSNMFKLKTRPDNTVILYKSESYDKQDLVDLIEWFDSYRGESYLSYDIIEDFLKTRK